MNKSYRSIYNETTGTYVAVQETARAKGKRSSSSVAVCAASLLVASTMGLAAGDAVANSVTFNDQQVWGGSVNKSGVAYTNATPQGNLIASDTELNIPGATQEAGDPAGNIGEYIKQSILMGNGASFATVGGKYGIYDRFERVVAIGSKAAVAQPGDVFDVTVLGASAIAGSYDHRFNNGTQLPGAWTDTNSLRGATAIGGSAKALSSRATALGYQSEARGIGTIAIGSGAIAGVSATNNTGTGDVANAIAIGNASNASAASSVAIGREAQAIGESTVAIGSIAGKNALGAKSVLIGYESGLDSASGNSVYIGDGAGRGQKADPRGNIGSSSLPGHNVGIGHWTLYNSTGEGNTALGLRAGREQKGSDNTHIGAFAGHLQDGDYNVNAGYFAGQKSKGEKNLNLGIEAGASHTGSSSVSLGDSANKGTTSERSVAIGRSSASTGNDSIALGSQAIAGNAVWDSVGGKYSASTALNDIAIGTASKAAGGNSIALGASATASGAKSIAIGYGNDVRGAGSGAIGDPSRIDGNASYAMGNDNVVGTGSNNVFILGNNVNIGATAVQRDANGIVTGYTLANTAPGAVALGHNTGVTVAGGVALGESSKATTDKGVVGLNTATGAASTVTSPTWKSTLAAVSVGNGSTATRQITGVAAGFNDTDAVNVAQLKAGQVHYLSVNDGGVQGTNYANDGATKDGAIAIGKNATASYENAISIGNTRNVSKDSIAIGNGISSFFGTGSKNILIGNASGMYSTNSGIIGNNSAIYNLKYGEPTNNAGSYIIGNDSGVGLNTDDAFIIGNNVTIGTAKTVFASPNSISGGGAPVNGAVALGSNTTVTAAGAVALGKGSKATTDKDVVGFNTVTGTVADTKVSPFDTNSWKSTHAAVSIGDGTTVTRQLTGLAAGTQDTDAVNVAQLKNSQIHFFSVNSTGVTDGNYSNNGAQGADSIAIGKNALTKTTDAVVIGRGATTSVGTRDSQGNVVVIGAQAKTISQNAVVIGQGAEIYDDVLNLHDSVAIGAGAKISGFAQESIAIGSGVITGLSNTTWNGTATTGRAATEDQLKKVHDAAKATADAAVQYDAQAGGVVNKDSVTLAGTTGTDVTKNTDGTFTSMSGGTALNNVASAGDISDVNNAYKAVNAGDLNNQVAGLTSKGLKFTANNGTVHTAALGSTISVKGAAANTDADKFDEGKNIMTSVDASGNILVAMAKDLKANSVTVGATGAQTQLSSTGANQLQIGSTGAKPITVDAATGVITGLSNTTWNGTATTGRAATEDQLKKVHDAAKATADAAVQYDAQAGGVVNKDSVTLAGTTGTDVTKNTDGTFTSMSGGTALNNVASAGDISDVNNAYKAVNAGDLNNQVAGLTSKGLKFTANNGTVHTAALGSTISVKGAAANTDADKFDEGKNIMTSVDASGNILVAMAKDLKADSVSTGATTINNDGLTITGGPSVTTTGINAGSKAITNVADGTVAADSKDAVTGGQLYGTADSVKTILGGNAALGADGKLTMSNIGGTGKGTIDEAVKAAYDKAGEAADAAKKHTTVVAGQNVTVTEGTNADGGKEYTVAVKDDIELTSVTTGATKMDTTGVTIKNADPAKTVSLTADGLNNGGNKITNVADGAVAANSKDAVTGGQLYSTNTQVAGNTAALGGGAKFDSASNTFTAPVYNVTDANGNAKVVNDVGSAIEALNQGFKVTSAATGSGTVSGTATTAVKSGSTTTYVAGDNIALTQDGMKFTIATNKNVNFDKVTVGDVVLDKDNGIDAGNKQITNVGDGVNPGDAVNKKQLEAAINGNKEGLNALQQQIGQVSADANAGAASAMATAGLPQAYTPGKSMIAAAGSVYKGATAQAIGISTITENGKWVFKGSVNVNNRGYAGATVGVGYQW